MSTRAFLGRELAQNEDWIHVSVTYSIDAFHAARELRQWPSILRPIVYRFLSSVHKIQKSKALGTAILDKEVQRRKTIRCSQVPTESVSCPADTLDWMNDICHEMNLAIDMFDRQMALSLAAIHTTSNLFTNIMYDLAVHPELIQPLRDEISLAFTEDGYLKKTTLIKLKLMDSVMKETQRVNPISFGNGVKPDNTSGACH